MICTSFPACGNVEQKRNAQHDTAVPADDGSKCQIRNYDSLVVAGVAQAEFNARLLSDQVPISKSILQHKIRNKTLRDIIIAYDKKYNEGEKGIDIGCQKRGDTLVYWISYLSFSTFSSFPMIKCEPLNDRDITMCFMDFDFDVELPSAKALKLNRDGLKDKDFQDAKKELSSYRLIEGEFAGPNDIYVNSSKISLQLLFDKQHKLIRIDSLGYR